MGGYAAAGAAGVAVGALGVVAYQNQGAIGGALESVGGYMGDAGGYMGDIAGDIGNNMGGYMGDAGGYMVFVSSNYCPIIPVEGLGEHDQ